MPKIQPESDPAPTPAARAQPQVPQPAPRQLPAHPAATLVEAAAAAGQPEIRRPMGRNPMKVGHESGSIDDL